MPKSTCSIDGCEEPHYGRTFCVKHYKADHYQRNKAKYIAMRAVYIEEHTEEIKTYMADYYRAHSDLLKDRARVWREQNPEIKRRNDAAWVERNLAYKKARDRRRWNSDPERNKRIHHAWYLQNKPVAKEAWHRRRAMKIANGYERVDLEALLAEHGMFCHICKTPIATRSDLHFDHVIPLSKGGPHYAANIRPAHAKCNLSKGSKILTN